MRNEARKVKPTNDLVLDATFKIAGWTSHPMSRWLRQLKKEIKGDRSEQMKACFKARQAGRMCCKHKAGLTNDCHKSFIGLSEAIFLGDGVRIDYLLENHIPVALARMWVEGGPFRTTNFWRSVEKG